MLRADVGEDLPLPALLAEVLVIHQFQEEETEAMLDKLLELRREFETRAETREE